jgi:hypothetical protein
MVQDLPSMPSLDMSSMDVSSMDQSTTRILSEWADTKKDFSREDMRQITQTLKQEAQTVAGEQLKLRPSIDRPPPATNKQVKAPSSSSESEAPPMVWSESPNLRSQVGLSPSIRPIVGLYGDSKMVQDLSSMPSLDVSSMDPPPSTHVQVNSVAVHDSRQSHFRPIALAPSSEWLRQSSFKSNAEADTRKKAKNAMISGIANMFKFTGAESFIH